MASIDGDKSNKTLALTCCSCQEGCCNGTQGEGAFTCIVGGLPYTGAWDAEALGVVCRVPKVRDNMLQGAACLKSAPTPQIVYVMVYLQDLMVPFVTYEVVDAQGQVVCR